MFGRKLRGRGALGSTATITCPAALVPGAAQASSSCALKGPFKHVIYVQFDNTHLTRDNPGVYSDLEQMPHLLGFLKDNGTVLQKHYTVLISHTAGGGSSARSPGCIRTGWGRPSRTRTTTTSRTGSRRSRRRSSTGPRRWRAASTTTRTW